nr:uncharacterized protein LOC128702353 [Cherax quadricarinatus]XP_053652571.1 uncharacterized protein LOC128702363 [Cherax quadricarinatus]
MLTWKEKQRYINSGGIPRLASVGSPDAEELKGTCSHHELSPSLDDRSGHDGCRGRGYGLSRACYSSVPPWVWWWQIYRSWWLKWVERRSWDDGCTDEHLNDT